MKYTSAEANKLLRKYKEQLAAIKKKEEMSCKFIVSLGENPESIRPVYDYQKTQQEIEDVENRIVKLKHAINLFNINTLVPEFDMTIDQMLVYIPQLTERKAKLVKMSGRLPKQRVAEHRYYERSNTVEYDYANYSVEQADADLEKVSEELSKAQNALDMVNATVQFEIKI